MSYPKASLRYRMDLVCTVDRNMTKSYPKGSIFQIADKGAKFMHIGKNSYSRYGWVKLWINGGEFIVDEHHFGIMFEAT